MTIQRRKAVTQCCWWSLQWKMSLQKGTMKTDGGGRSYPHHVAISLDSSDWVWEKGLQVTGAFCSHRT